MVTRLGTILGTQLGTDLSTFADNPPPPSFDASKLYAISGITGVDHFATASGGGEAGVGTGFGTALLFLPRSYNPVANQMLAHNRNAGGTLGRQTYLMTTGAMNFYAWDGGGTVRIATVTPSPRVFGQITMLLCQHTGSSIRAILDRLALSGSLALTGYSPNAPAREYLGMISGLDPANRVDFLGYVTFRGVPTDAQLQTLYDLTRTKGDVPTAAEWPYGVTHRWSLRDVLAAANVPVTTGTVAPATIPDSVTAATVDTMTRNGSPTITVIDPSTDGRLSYGVLGFSATSVLQSAAGASFRGNGAGFTVRVVATFYSIAAGVEYYASCATPGVGWSFQRSAAVLNYYVGNGAAVNAAKTLTAADLGVPHLLHMVWNGSTVEGFFDGVSVGVSAAGGFSAAAGTIPVTIGALGLTATNPATNESVFALSGANYVVTSAEVAADYANWRNTQRLANITASKPDANRYDLTTDTVANGGPSAGIPATVLDRVGTDHLTRVGTGLQVAQRVERLWSYESTPILYGAEAFTDADYYEAAAGGVGDAAGFWATVVLTPTALGASATRVLLSTASVGRGWDIRTGGSNATLSVSFIDGAGTQRSSGAGVLGAAAVGKTHLFTFGWEASTAKLRVYLNRAEIGTGTTATGHVAGLGSVRLGRSMFASLPAPDLRAYGFALGNGAPTLAQVQAHHDAILAADGRIQALAGLTTTMLVDATLDAQAAGGTLGTTLQDRSGSNHMTRAGAPATGHQYARAFGF